MNLRDGISLKWRWHLGLLFRASWVYFEYLHWNLWCVLHSHGLIVIITILNMIPSRQVDLSAVNNIVSASSGEVRRPALDGYDNLRQILLLLVRIVWYSGQLINIRRQNIRLLLWNDLSICLDWGYLFLILGLAWRTYFSLTNIKTIHNFNVK